MDNFSLIASLWLIGLFLITCPAEGYVAVNIDKEDQRHQLSLWKRDTMADPQNTLDEEEGVIWTPEDKNYTSNGPDQSEINYIRKLADSERDNQDAREEEDNSINQLENTDLQINEQQDKENEIDNGQNTAAVINSSATRQSKL